MRNFLQLTVLVLCSHNLFCESQTVEVHPNEDITLFCSNISQSATQTEWFRVINRTEPSCISSMYGAEGEASYCNGIQNEKFEMSSNTTTVFLQIKRVDPWDCGLYFCGFYMNKHTVIGNGTDLIIKANEDSNDELDTKNIKEADQQTDLTLGILGALTFLLFVAVIILAVKNRKLQTASRVKLQKDRNKNLDSDDLNYTALSFQADSKDATGQHQTKNYSHMLCMLSPTRFRKQQEQELRRTNRLPVNGRVTKRTEDFWTFSGREWSAVGGVRYTEIMD